MAKCTHITYLMHKAADADRQSPRVAAIAINLNFIS